MCRSTILDETPEIFKHIINLFRFLNFEIFQPQYTWYVRDTILNAF